MLIADSWFGSVACILALFERAIYAIMNVKTAHKGYPKDELMAEVGEVKGNTPEAKELRAQKRGKHAGFRQEFAAAGDRKVTVLAAGHNKKVPLLLVATHSSLLPGEDHKKVWHVNLPDGTTQYYSKVTKQPEVHELYRKHMNHVDLHNKLRQGVVSMADVWQTTSWVERHFAEGLGLWEVNVYKALLYFQASKWKGISHSDFRARLAHALMTLGKVEYPEDRSSSGRTGSTPGFTSPPTTTSCPPPQPMDGFREHTWVYDRALHKRCCYCGQKCHNYCKTCNDSGRGCFYACSTLKRGCMGLHVAGEPVKHYSFMKRKKGGATSSSNQSSESGDGIDEGPPQHRPRESPNSVWRRQQRASASSNSGARRTATSSSSSAS